MKKTWNKNADPFEISAAVKLVVTKVETLALVSESNTCTR